VHERAAILSIGDELVVGATLDTNARRIARRLTDAGVTVVQHATVPDDLPALVDAFRGAADACDVVVATGGLGPTADDLTRRALADAAGEALVEDDDALEQVRAFFKDAGRPMPEPNRVQAMRPASARCLRNDRGTAPGLHTTALDADVFCLPGPPREMIPMLEAFVLPALRVPPGRVVGSRVLRCVGIGESDLAGRLGDLMKRDRNPLVGTTASGGVVSVRIRYEGAAGDADDLMDRTAREAARRAAPFVFGEGDTTIAEAVLLRLEARSERLVTVESCTGGLVGKMLTDVPGSSAAILGGWITYTNELKHALVGVPMDVFERAGAVSRDCADAMARGGRERSGADHALAITGIAGPGGGSDEKPVGTVWIARRSKGGSTDVRRFRFLGERANVRAWSALAALAMLRLHLDDEGATRLLREA